MAAAKLESKIDALLAANSSLSPAEARKAAFINEKLDSPGARPDAGQRPARPARGTAHDLLHRHSLRLQCGDPAGAHRYGH